MLEHNMTHTLLSKTVRDKFSEDMKIVIDEEISGDDYGVLRHEEISHRS